MLYLRSLRVIQVGLLLLLFSLASSLGLTWRSYAFGIAFGYGTYAIVDLVLSAIRVEYGDAVWKLESYCTTVSLRDVSPDLGLVRDATGKTC